MQRCYNCKYCKETNEDLFGATLKYTECSKILGDGIFYDDGGHIQVASQSVRVGLNFGCVNWIEKESAYDSRFSESESKEAQQKVS